MLVPSIKNLIFDLGGVILDLSVDHTLKAFALHAGIEKEKAHHIFTTAAGFEEYEKGAISDEAFRDFVREAYNITSDNQTIDKCWNAMLRGIPQVKLDLLIRLQSEFQVFLLSNTNGIHLDHINQVMLPQINGSTSLDSYFNKAYYSHRMLKRKPDAEIFEQVIDENHLVPEQTLFLDDNAVNIEGAKFVGLRTIHVTSPNLILDYFHA